MHQKLLSCLALAVALSQLLMPATGESYEVDRHNVSELVDSHELVLLLFYSNRCKYSRQLMPIYESAASQLHSRLGGTGNLALGKVDCDRDPEMESHYDIGKYPTIKIVRNKYVNKKEYRGQRSVEAIVSFALEELLDPIQEFVSLNELYDLNTQKYLVIGHYERNSHEEYKAFRRAASNMKDHCQFHVKFTEASGPNSLTFQEHLNHTESLSLFTGNMSSQEELMKWFTTKCIPIVRELTFSNAEELTEEGRLFVILFHNPQDKKSPKDFKKVVHTELMDEVDKVIFLTADGILFASPLLHMNKTEADLPFIAIDSFAHMYPFPEFEDLYKPGKLREFVKQLHTGDLHWNYHFSEFMNSIDDNEDDIAVPSLLPPASKFIELRPSKHRYTFARDEL
ncbi:endoplasmic reticulum resident protein 44 [Drosophila mojavensis]|uniref:endoplasmic reticulum resident protein 44 n=1 Tax=Drosophila mojavensis TaxID=7230 RepID=UPI001CD12837|nr:endoplasmic reticulum resident protein 44 [Drosophila mojavensis]